MVLTQLTKVDGGGISTTSDYRVGVITATKFVGPFDGTGGNFSGIITASGANFSGNVTIGGTLTYEDVTNIDSVGIITAPAVDVDDFLDVGNNIKLGNAGVVTATTFKGDGDFVELDVDGHTNLDNVSIVGVTTIQGTLLDLNSNSANPAIFKLRTNVNTSEIEARKVGGENHLVLSSNNSTDHLKITGNTVQLPNDDQRLEIGANQELKIAQDGTHNVTYMQNVGPLQFQTDDLRLYNFTTQDLYLRAQTNAGVSLYYDYSTYSTAKLATTATGVTIDGTAVAGALDVSGDIDVDGHTNLDNVSVAGITTFSNGPVVVNGQYYRGIINSGSQEKIVGGYISGSDTLRLGESMYLTSTGLGIGVASPSQKLDVGGNGKFNKTGNCNVLIGSTNAGGAAIVLDGDSDGNGSGADYAYIEHDTSGNLNIVATNPADSSQMVFNTGDGSEALRITSSGEVRIPSGSNSTSRLTFGGGVNIYHDNNFKIENSTGYLKLQSNNNLYIDGDQIYLRNEGGTNRWIVSTNGHLVPGTAGTYNIGSTSEEIGDVYIADDKKLQIGSSQDLQIYHTNSGTSWIRHTNSSEYFILEGNQMDFRDYATGVYRARMGTAVQLYYNGNNVKLATTNTGITVTGEVAASQDYPMVKPTLDCNFVLNKKLDPRIGYTRKGVASFYDEQGILKIVGDNVPRFDHNPETRESLGILIEEERTNNQPHSEQWSPVQQDGFLNVISGMDVDYDPGVVTPTGETTGAITFMETGASGQHYIAFDVFGATVSGTSYTFSFFFKNISGGGSGNANNVKVITTTAAFPYMIRTFYFDGPDAGTTSHSDSTITKLPNGWWRGTFTATANNNFGSAAWTMDLRGLNGGAAYNNKIAIWGIQTETGAFPTSYIRTGNSDYGRTATRGVDFLQIQGQAFTDLYNPVESTILCSYQHTKEVATISADLGGSRRVYRFGTGDTSSDTRIDFVSTSTFHPFISGDGSSPANLTATAPTRANVNTYATRVKENDFATTKAGAAISGNAQDTSGAWDPVNKMIEVQIGGTLTGASDAALQAHYKRFTYYPVGLPNSQLITISS